MLCFLTSIAAYGQTSDNNCDSGAVTEATLTVDGAAHDGSFESAGGLHYFQMDPASDIDVIIRTVFTSNNLDYSLQLCDSSDDLIASDSNDNRNISAPLVPGTYYIVVGSSGADQYQLQVITDTRDNTSSSDCEDLITGFPDDPLYGCQWHLNNTGQWRFNGQRITAGEDINVEGVWNDEILASGINVAVVDDGIDSDHEDLADNVNSDLNHDYSGNDNVFSPLGHGTRTGGVIAAVGDNELGVRGVAPQASIYSYNLLDGSNGTSANIADAMTRNHVITAVSSNSWGATDRPSLHNSGRAWELAVETGIREGFGGKGVFYVWSAGNGHTLYDQANFEEYSNYYAVTSVCSVDGFGRKSSFSEEGVSLWICAPGSFITTTANNDRYGFREEGTSFSAPAVSGVAALMREVNGDLSWRDLKLILAASARRNDPTDPGWETGALKYGSDTDSYNYNPKYGFGVVDAEAAVELAENWNRVAQMKTLTASSGNINTAIPDHTGGADGEIISSLNISDTDLFTEFVEINLRFTHTFFADLEIQITSPDGTVSKLSKEHVQGAMVFAFLFGTRTSYTNYTHRFGSAKHLGEDPAGEWTLNISDTASRDVGTLHSWSIKVYGHRSDDTVPSFSSNMITDKEYLTGIAVTETLPEAAGGNGTLIYSLTPALPDGLDFDEATREISGTPTTVTSKTMYTYAATDDEGDTSQIKFGITVGSDVPTFSGETISDKEYVTDTAITETLPVAVGGDGALTYSITPALPTGLIFTPATREISGTPTTAMSKTVYTYTAEDEEGDTDELTFGITVEADRMPDFGSNMIADKEYLTGVAVTEILPAATGGNGTLTYSLAPSDIPVIFSFLPDGLDFDETTREISGTPTTVTSKTMYTYTVIDGDGDTDQIKFGITVGSDVPTFSGETISDKEYVTDTAITETLPVAVGGDGALTYSITPALPAGLIFTPATRVLSGTPESASSGTYTYTVRDEEGDTADLTFGITVETDSMPEFGGNMIADKEYVAGKTTNLPVTLPEATGGNGTLRYTITPDLPAGLDFDETTREISGTPTTATNKRMYTYTVTDKDGDSDDLTFGITVEADSMPDFGGNMIADKEYVAGKTANLPVTLPEATGGNGDLIYSLNPSLPAGLIFTPATREISGAPTAAMPKDTYTYTVRDKDGDTDDLTFGITVEADSLPDFGGKMIGDQEYIAGKTTNLPVTLPEATGGNGTLRYTITPALPAGLDLNEITRVLSGTPTTAMPEDTYTYTVTDKDGDTDDLMFGITVAADDRPTFSETIDDQEYVAGTATNLPVTLPAAAGGNAPLTYSITPILPAGLNFSASTRVISGTPVSASSGTYTYTVRDKDGDRFELRFGITVEADTEPTFGGEMIADKEYLTGIAVTEILPEATGGNGALRYSITPTLPTGLNFNASTPPHREISGTPTTAASRTVYTYTVTDEDGDTDELSFGITVAANEEPAFSDAITDQEYIAGKTTNLPVTLPAAAGGNAPLTYSLTPKLPTGLYFNASTRVISGTPASASSGTYTYTVRDKDGDTADLSFGITVAANEEPSFSDTIANQEYIAGKTTNLPVTLPAAAGGNAPLTYSLTPALPTGLIFTSATREISGTPATAMSKDTYTYTVEDIDGDTADLSFGITVAANEEPSFSDTIANQEYIAGKTINIPVTLPEAAGGNGTLTYSLTPKLPTGLDFNENTREISGTPATAMSKDTYTYTVEDIDGDTAKLTFGITVTANEEPTFSDMIDDQEYIAGKTINLPVTLPAAAGGNGTLTYSITPGLPAGLIFTPATREISGTPTTAASRTVYTYTVTDVDGDTAELMFGITILADAMPTFSGETIDDKEYIAGSSITPVTLPAATSGNGGLRYSITPALPTGLSFNSATQEISGTPTTAMHETPYTWSVTDVDGDTAELMFRITIEEDSTPDLDGTTISTQMEYTAGRPITLPEATGGNPPVTYSITPDLPAGLSFNEVTREISGTPTRASTDTYRYIVTDRNGDTDEVSFILIVEAPPAPPPPPNPRPRPAPDTEAGGGGGGCAVSDQSNVVPDLLGVMACLILIPVSVAIRRKRRYQIKT